jgi:hypothetical protein
VVATGESIYLGRGWVNFGERYRAALFSRSQPKPVAVQPGCTTPSVLLHLLAFVASQHVSQKQLKMSAVEQLRLGCPRLIVPCFVPGTPKLVWRAKNQI